MQGVEKVPNLMKNETSKLLIVKMREKLIAFKRPL